MITFKYNNIISRVNCTMLKRGQISFEYLVIVGFVTVLALVLLGISTFYSNQTRTLVNTNQLDQVARQVVDTAETVYFYGAPSKATIKAQMPRGIKAIIIESNEVVFTVSVSGKESNITYGSDIPLGGEISISPGLRNIVIEAQGGLVWINGT